MKSILDPTFKYVPAVQTDIRKTFDRVRWQMKREALDRAAKVQPITQRKGAA